MANKLHTIGGTGSHVHQAQFLSFGVRNPSFFGAAKHVLSSSVLLFKSNGSSLHIFFKRYAAREKYVIELPLYQPGTKDHIIALFAVYNIRSCRLSP